MARSLATTCLLALFAGCANDPGTMTKVEVESKLKDALKLREISLEERPEGFGGTARTADGTLFVISVKQKPEDRSLSYTLTNESNQMTTAGSFKQFGPRWAAGLERIHKDVKLLLMTAALGGLIVAVVVMLVRRSRS